MKIQIRTKDDLIKLLSEGISYAWRVNKGRLNSITEVEIYNFSGNARIIGAFDREKTKVLDNGRVAVAFTNAKIEPCEFKWVGQNPIKYKSHDNSEIELMEDEEEMDNNNDSDNNLSNDKFEMIDWNKASDVAKTLNPIVFQWISRFFDSKDHQSFDAQITQDNCLRILSKYPKADVTSEYWFDLSLSGLEFYFSNRNTGLYIEVLNEFDDFNSYFEVDYTYGSTLARLLNQKYNEVFESRIDSGDDIELDEDFKLYFIDNFVNYILNNVYIEE